MCSTQILNGLSDVKARNGSLGCCVALLRPCRPPSGSEQPGAGKIINICSVQTDLARPSIAPYTAAKGGLRNLTRAMTAEWAAGGLQINGLAPGYIHTEMTQALVDDSTFNDWILGRTPARRWGTVDDLVGPAVFLASPASSYMNGQVLFVDGGMTAVV